MKLYQYPGKGRRKTYLIYALCMYLFQNYFDNLLIQPDNWGRGGGVWGNSNSSLNSIRCLYTLHALYH